MVAWTAALSTPELDEVLYRLEVLRLEHGESPDELDDEYVQDISALDDASPKLESILPRSGSITTSISADVTSGSASAVSHSTSITSRSSHDDSPVEPRPAAVKRPAVLQKAHSTSDYERFMAHAERNLKSPTLRRDLNHSPSMTSPLALSARKPYASIRRRFTQLSRSRKDRIYGAEIRYCARCRGELREAGVLQRLPCGHTYCGVCLRNITLSAMRNGRVVPMTCCKKPVPASTLKRYLGQEEQSRFVRMILRLNGDRDRQVSCPSCGGFTVKDVELGSLAVECGTCKLKFCTMCVGDVHPVGLACPADWALDVLRRLGDHQKWIRCNGCRKLQGFGDERTHMTCHCGSEICCVCGSSWTVGTGCINSCKMDGLEGCAKSEAEVEVKAICEESPAPECADVTHILEILEAGARSIENKELQELRRKQLEEQDRFLAFEQKQKWMMWTRHGQRKVEILDKHGEVEQEMKKRHLERSNALEDRHLLAEIELCQSLAQERKACLIRLKHMEQYCNTTADTDSSFPTRHITPRDLRELSQQYDLRDDMGRLHEARINVLRDKQTRQLETVEKGQREELEEVVSGHEKKVESLEAEFASDEAGFERLFGRRKERLMKKWATEEGATRVRLEKESDRGDVFGPLPSITWPGQQQGPHHSSQLSVEDIPVKVVTPPRMALIRSYTAPAPTRYPRGKAAI